MTTREEIRDGMGERIKAYSHRGPEALTDILIEFQHSKRVVIKTEGDLSSVPTKRNIEENWVNPRIRATYLTAQQDMIRAGYTKYEELI